MNKDIDPIPTPALDKAWLELLKEMGAETVRARLCNGEVQLGNNSNVKFARVFIDGRPMVPKRPYVEKWLAIEDRKARRRSSIQNALVWIGAIAAVIGAITGLISITQN